MISDDKVMVGAIVLEIAAKQIQDLERRLDEIVHAYGCLEEESDARLAALKAALKEIERQSDEAIATCDGDGCLCCTTMDDINRRMATALALTEGGS